MSGGLDIQHDPVRKDAHDGLRVEIRRRFPEISSCHHDSILLLSKYLQRKPERFYSSVAFQMFLGWLQRRDCTSRSQLQQYLLDEEAELSRAFLHLQEINSLDWHDRRLELEDYELVQFLDREVHPTYLRLTEAVYAPLTRIAAHFSRLDHGKGTQKLDVFNIVEELPRASLKDITSPYEKLVRNAIAHGGITFLQNTIRYQDKNGKQCEYLTYDVIRLCDDMLDTCNGLALALSLFLLSRQSDGYSLPRQLLIDELKEETRSPWWEIIGCTPGEIINRKKQLMIHVRVRTYDYLVVLYYSIRSAVLAERFAPGYDRYFFGLQSPCALPGWAIFDGGILRQLRANSRATLEDYGKAIVDRMVFYVPKVKLPSIVLKVMRILTIYRAKWPLEMAKIREQLGLPVLDIRNSHIHRNGWGLVLRADVVLHTPDPAVTQEIIRKNLGRLMRSALRDARRSLPLYSVTRYLPLGFARVAVFRRDYRARRLGSFGLGEDLIGTVQVSRIRRIKAPDISGATIEVIGRFRVAWNKAWLTIVSSSTLMDDQIG